ncbi:acetylxylan esterase precursor [Drepanopeziza brunnea f. sp. 'multigermtubi' MB_m1]|uniref:Acetylxylan esterase n=2 Tax=Drepanopeziza brunnea f. sp. 'multigermtubi' TaxID=698441 RepID=K1XKB7_MARBU|nr:acetylxylan esterase precursor [Drepanopeziza brunnea f. sp. 'multigermtubi' MB_m1]EKD21073.1 acetylxylan esterase precursor [Drepanopeziza brunnea f. sp. 'multigermtubi' MB_m1]
MQLTSAAAATLFLGRALASPVDIEERQSCPEIHVFGARETTVSPGLGTARVVVNLVLNAYPGSTSEAIDYPACGGQASCGGASYGESALQGTAAAAAAVNAYHTKCPNSILVVVGYSQGAQIFDNSICGGGDTNIGLSDTAVPIEASALSKLAAAIFMGNPRHIVGLPYNVGTCQASGFAPRPAGFECPSASKIQSYCDEADPYCCKGSDQATHQGYGTEYGQAAFTFIQEKIAAMGTGGETSPTLSSAESKTSTPASPKTDTGKTDTGKTDAGTVARYEQCGGSGWTGATACVSPYTCKTVSTWYHQCL